MLGSSDQQYTRPRSKRIIKGMILKVCDSLPILTMKMKVMQIGKGREDAPLNLTVMEKELIIYKALCSLITAS